MDDTKMSTPGMASLPDRYLTPADVAHILGVPVKTLYQWRYLRTGPPAFRVGRHVRYDPVAVREWVDRQVSQAREAA